jgi:PAS domain S-box-containing protein
VTALAVLGAAILYPQIRTLTRSTVDRIFYRDKYNFRRTLVGFGRELNSELDLDVLIGKIESRVRQTLGFDRLALYLFDDARGDLVRVGKGTFGPERLAGEPSLLERVRRVSYLDLGDLPSGSIAAEALSASELTTLFPAKVKGEVRALLAVGRRSEEEPLTSEDVQMLVALLGQAASAIEAARLLKQVGEKVDEVERLRRTNENILESSRVGILVIDGEGRVQNCNRALEDLTGVPRSESLGRRMAELYSLPLVREIEQLISRVRATKGHAQPRAFRSSITNRAGERVRVNIGLSALGNLPGGPDGWVVTLDDITEQVRFEERLLRHDRLAAIGLLASGVAHEVNTPLTGISSYAQMLLEEADPSDPKYELLRKIEQQTARASSIANSLLNFSRGSRPGQTGGEDADSVPSEESVESLDLTEVVDEALALFEPQLRGFNIKLTKGYEPGLPRIAGHRGKLQQVLLNLLLNARDAIGSEGTLHVSLKSRMGRLVLEVTDDGCGIPEEDLGRVFDPFFTTKSRGKGTGLGLSLSYNIIKEHRGDISVDSHPGRGTTFTVELPLDRRAAAGR